MAKKTVIEPLVFVNGETGEEVVIEYNRMTILRMERLGYSGEKVAESIKDAPLSTMADLFYFGMLMHQPNTTKDEAYDFFFENVGFDEKLIERLTGLFMKPYTDMLEAQRKNSLWTVK